MAGELIGRGAELRAATEFLDRLDDGPFAILIEGDAGIGKTTLWRAIAAVAAERGAQVLTARPAGSETQLAFAGLADLLDGVTDETLATLPGPQRRAVEIALLRVEPEGEGSDARPASAGTAALLRTLAAERPVLIALDDGQWLDPASREALAFAVRRLGDSRIGLLLALRPPEASNPLDVDAALPAERILRLRLGPLSAGALYHLFEDRLGHAFPRSTIVRIAEACDGNPFYALEVARAMLDEGRGQAGAPMPVPAAVRDLAADRIRRLPAAARGELLRVAAIARPTSALVDVGRLAPAEAEGLVDVDLDGRITFTHPLFAAAVYHDASAAERRAVHRDLSGAIPELDLEERARHAALAATGPDPITALVLVAAGARARARGSTASAAELIELALRLTPADDIEDRVRREIELAEDLHLAGQLGEARRVLEAALDHATDGDLRGEALLALGMTCREIDPPRAIEVSEEALSSAVSAGLRARAHATLGYLFETIDVARATVHSAAAAELFAGVGDDASWAAATIGHCWHELLLGHGADDETFERALEAPHGGPAAGRWWAGLPAVWVLAHDDFESAASLFAGSLARLRQEGNEGEIGLIRAVLAQIDCWRGHRQAADENAAAAVELSRLGGSPASLADALRVQANIDALRGRVDRARETLGPRMAALGIPDAGRLTYGTGVVLGFVAHSIGDELEADRLFARTSVALETAGILEMPGYLHHGDHVEAVLALGDVDRAEAIVAGLEARSRVFPRPWTLAVGARCRGLILAARGDLDGALGSMEAALIHHQRLESPYELGRTLTAKAQVHRRRTEKRLAREALERAVALLERCGADLWAERARNDLGRLRSRASPTELTETELRIASLAAAGHTNREIASTVFVSPKTVEARLASVYGKLGIRSRAELGAWMAATASATANAATGAATNAGATEP